jgi:hypothetical protein
MTPDENRARRTRNNYVVAGALIAWVVLFFFVTIVRLGGAASS